MHAQGALLRAAGIAVAAMVVTLSLTTVSRAVQTSTTPNAVLFSYNLLAGQVSAQFTPPAGQSVFVMGCCSTTNDRGVGHVTMLRATDLFLEWTGLNSPASSGITAGFSGVAGTDIVKIDFAGQVVIEVAGPNSFRIHNGSSAQKFGNVTVIW